MQHPFEAIRPFRDEEINAAVLSIAHDPLMKAFMTFAFPDNTDTEHMDLLAGIHSIYDFQGHVVYPALQRMLSLSTQGLTRSGFEDLDPDTAYLYLSNHRDIVLDNALLNLILFEENHVMTATAIGDNLVRMPVLYSLARINRNFLVRRGLPHRELLESSKVLSEYILHLLSTESRSVWIAQREGRAKDGNDFTHPGVLKMIGMAAGGENLAGYFKRLRIVPVSISYEYDPTDTLKLPELLAAAGGETYVKEAQADFQHILTGLSGPKGRIHFHAGKVLDEELDALAGIPGANQQVKTLTGIIDRAVMANYKLWPGNYIAADLLSAADSYNTHYTEAEKQAFMERMRARIEANNEQALKCFLAMYANPVINRIKN